ncbi:hypothetical protein LCGC14_2913210, partial [marine sediment metagenome]
DILRNIPAAHRWLSIEPLLGDLGKLDLKSGMIYGGIDWVVVGCESGPNRRPCKIEWIESIVKQCEAADVKVYVKQIDTGKVEKDINKFPKQLQVRQALSPERT